MADIGKWQAFSEEKTSGWTAVAANGAAMEVWASIDEPKQFRVSVRDMLYPDFYPSREEAFSAAEQLAARTTDAAPEASVSTPSPVDAPEQRVGVDPEVDKAFDAGGF